jgi:hypothetical protein
VVRSVTDRHWDHVSFDAMQTVPSRLFSTAMRRRPEPREPFAFLSVSKIFSAEFRGLPSSVDSVLEDLSNRRLRVFSIRDLLSFEWLADEVEKEASGVIPSK